MLQTTTSASPSREECPGSSRRTADRIPVVIRFIGLFGKWYICHERSYQNAFSRDVNGYDNRSEAVEFAESNGCEVIFHDFDELQAHNQ